MLDYLYEWIQNIAFCMVMVTAVMHIIPNPDYKRYIRFFTGLVLVVMLVSPFLKLLGMGDLWRDLYDGRAYQEQVEKMKHAMQSSAEAGAADYLNDIEIEESKEIDVEEIRIGR